MLKVAGGGGGGGGGGTVTSVTQSFTGGLISVSGSPVTTAGTLALTVAGTSGGVPYFNSGTTWLSSAALAANAIVVGGGAGAAPATVTTNSTVLTALGVAPQGSGGIVLATTPTITSPIIGITSFADYWQPAGSSATQATVSFQALGTDTNINVSLTPKGTGAVIAGPIPDGTATGGNARGANAIDLQISRAYSDQVASGTNSAVLGGYSSKATNSYSIAVGNSATASGVNSVALGFFANASGQRSTAFNQATSSGADSFSSGYLCSASGVNSFVFGDRAAASGASSIVFGNSANAQSRHGSFTLASSTFTLFAGDAQHFFQTLRIATSATTLARLTSDAGAAGSANIANLVNNSALRLTIDIVGRDTTTGDTGGWNIQAVMKRGANAAATALVGTPVVTVVGLDTAWVTQTSPSLTADTTNGGLNLSITPITANASRWVARVLAVEVA